MKKELETKIIRTLEGMAQSYTVATPTAKCEIAKMATKVIDIISKYEPDGYKETCCRLFLGYVKLYSTDQKMTRN